MFQAKYYLDHGPGTTTVGPTGFPVDVIELVESPLATENLIVCGGKLSVPLLMRNQMGVGSWCRLEFNNRKVHAVIINETNQDFIFVGRFL
jgi:hypothetical protein